MNPCVMWGGNGVFAMLPYGKKMENWSKKVRSTGKENCFPAYFCAEKNQSIAGGSISGGEGRKSDSLLSPAVSATVSSASAPILCLIGPLHKLKKRSRTVLDVRRGILFRKMMVTSRQLALDVFFPHYYSQWQHNVLHSRFPVPETTKRLNTSGPGTRSNRGIAADGFQICHGQT